MILADIGEGIIVAAAIVTIVVGVATLAPGGRKLVAGIWSWLVFPRREVVRLRTELEESKATDALLRQSYNVTADQVRVLGDELKKMSTELMLKGAEQRINAIEDAHIHNQEVADRDALQQEVQRLATHIVALNARLDTPAGARVAEHLIDREKLNNL
jgi:hypothetical protein